MKVRILSMGHESNSCANKHEIDIAFRATYADGDRCRSDLKLLAEIEGSRQTRWLALLPRNPFEGGLYTDEQLLWEMLCENPDRARANHQEVLAAEAARDVALDKIADQEKLFEAYRARIEQLERETDELEAAREKNRDGLVVIESPYASGATWARIYAQLALRDMLRLDGVAPYASHLLYTQVLEDSLASERERGMNAGWKLYDVGARAMVYTDFGITHGMAAGIAYAQRLGRPIVYRAFGSGVRERIEEFSSANRAPAPSHELFSASSKAIAWPGAAWSEQ